MQSTGIAKPNNSTPDKVITSDPWTKSGTGTWNNSTKTWTFGAGNGTLTANYANSKSFNLPALSKTGHTCKWAKGSTSGTQYAGGTSQTVTGNTTYYAVCSVNKVYSNCGRWYHWYLWLHHYWLLQLW